MPEWFRAIYIQLFYHSPGRKETRKYKIIYQDYLFKFFMQIFRKLCIFTVIHRAVDNTRDILAEGILQNRDQILRFLHTISFGMHAFCIFYKIRIGEIYETVLSEMIHLFPLDQSIAGIVEDQGDKWVLALRAVSNS